MMDENVENLNEFPYQSYKKREAFFCYIDFFFFFAPSLTSTPVLHSSKATFRHVSSIGGRVFFFFFKV